MSLDFFPIAIYSNVFYYTLFLYVIYCFFQLYKSGFSISKWGDLFFLILVLYIGLRPIVIEFGDMLAYSEGFNRIDISVIKNQDKDVGFSYFMLGASKLMSVNIFFLSCAFLYIYPLYLVCRKWFQAYWFYAFLLILASFSFWSYGTNGIRNGIAGSLFLLGISRDKRIWQILLIFVAINFHKSILLPTIGFAIAQFYNRPKVIISFWVFCIPLSLVAGSFWESFFAGLGFEDDRLSYLTEGNINQDDFSSAGFRWDFLLYSATAVFAGWYYIVRKDYKDKVYFWLFNTYVFANAFWILVIRANFSNRFAYLSWFMMALVIVYPLLKKNIVLNQNKKLANILFVYFSFTFLMNVILAK